MELLNKNMSFSELKEKYADETASGKGYITKESYLMKVFYFPTEGDSVLALVQDKNGGTFDAYRLNEFGDINLVYEAAHMNGKELYEDDITKIKNFLAENHTFLRG